MKLGTIWLAALSSVAVVLLASWTHQGFYSDPAMQVKAVQQFVEGQSPLPVDWAVPDNRDLSHDLRVTLTLWSPGTELAFWPLMRGGVRPATAARFIAIAALIAGAIGWVWWFAGFELPAIGGFVLALVFPWIRSASNALYLFTSEILVFAAVPWALLAALAVHNRRREPGAWMRAAALGLLAGILYIVKDSTVFVFVGILVWLAWSAWNDERRVSTSVTTAAVAALAAAVPVIALSVFYQSHGGETNLVTANLALNLQWQHPLYAIASPALAAADLESLLRYLLMHPVHGLTQNRLWLTVIGLPGGVLLILLLIRRRIATPQADLARFVYAASLLLVLVVWSVSPVVSLEARHVASAGFAALPLALAEGCGWWREGNQSARRLLVAALFVFLVAPFAYGVTSVFAKTWRYPRDYRPGPSGIYASLLAEHDAARVVDRLQGEFSLATDIWYLTEPMTALDLKGRAIIRHADFVDLGELRQDHFATSRAVRVHALLPQRFEESGKGPAIRAAFTQASHWRREPIAGSQYDRWTADVIP